MLIQADGPANSIQVQLQMGAAGSLTQRIRVRHLPGAPGLTPQPNHRSLGDVERAGGSLGQLLRGLEHRVKVAAAPAPRSTAMPVTRLNSLSGL